MWRGSIRIEEAGGSDCVNAFCMLKSQRYFAAVVTERLDLIKSCKMNALLPQLHFQQGKVA